MTNKMRFFRTGAAVAGAVGLMAFAATEARAQAAMSLEQATVSREVAQRTLNRMQINADTAKRIVEACVELARENNGSASVFVLAPHGDIVNAHVMDGQLPIGVETGLLKAQTVLYARTSSREVAERFSTVEGRVIRLQLGQASGLAYYFVPGGLPILVEDQLIGAIGVGGWGGRDEECAHHALTQVLGPQPPLTAAAAPGGGAQGPGAAGAQQGQGQGQPQTPAQPQQ